jgi:opacity protein-like surface antigen
MKKIVAFVLFLFALTQANAQEKYIYVNLDINTPLSNKGWLDKTSSRGLKFGYRKFITEKFSAGLDLGVANYSQYFPKETFEYPSGALTTDYFNYITSYTVTASGQYYFGGNDIFHPYAGIGLGAMNNQYTQYYNIYTDVDRSWGFLARPEAGVLVRISQRRSIGLMAAIHYDYATNQSDDNNYSNFTGFGVQVGVMFLDW